MINIREIKIHNFMSIEDTRFIINPGVHIILGRNINSEYSQSNGAGKSSLIESIPYVLYKSTSRSNEVSRRGTSDSYVSVDLEINGVPYEITRYINHKDLGNSIKLVVNGEDVSSRGIRRLEHDIQTSIGIPYDLFISSVMILQGFPVNFCSLTPTVRKSIIESMLGLVVWEDIQTIFNNARVEETKILNTNESLFNEKKLEMTALNSKIEGLLSMSDKYADSLREQIKTLKKSLFELTQEERSIDDEISNITTESFDSVKDDAVKLSNKISKLKQREIDLNSTLNSGECSVCHQKFPEDMMNSFSKEKDIITEKISKIESLLKEKQEIISKIMSLKDQKNSVYYKKIPINDQLKSLISSLNEAEDKSEINKLQENLSSLNEEVNELYKSFQISKDNVNNMGTILSTLQPSSKFRTTLISKYIGVLNTILTELSSIMFSNLNVQLFVSNNFKGIDLKVVDTISNKDINYKSLSGGERRRFDIIMVLAIQRFLIEVSSIDINIMVYDEIFDGLDNIGIERCLSCITSMFGADKAIYLISHNESIKSEFSSQILVSKYNGVSTVDYTDYR